MWLEAFEHYPRRIENLYEIIVHYRLAGKNELAARYYDWARTVPKPAHSLFLHHNIYDYLLDYEFVIVYYYLKDKSRYPADALPQAVLNLMKHNYNLPSVLSNYKFYAPALCSLPGYRQRDLPLDAAVRALAPETPLESTPSSVLLPGGDRLINVRFNNTVLTKDWAYLLQDGREITRNVCLRTSSSGEVVRSAHLLPDPPPCEDANIFVGRQDVRLFADGGGTVHYTATVCRRENGNKVFRIECGTYEGEAQRWSGTCLRSPCDAECEKNWSLYENARGQVRCVYSWHPLVRGRLEGENFVEEHRFEVPELRLARGSSHGVWHRGELWFLVHIVSYEKPRRYYHALVVLDPEMRQVRRLSTLFTLEGKPIEYCGGLAIEDERAVLHCSVRDASSAEVSVPLASLSWRTLAAAGATPAAPPLPVNLVYWNPTDVSVPKQGPACGNFGDELSKHDYVGVDISDAVIQARRNFDVHGIPGTFIQANLQDLPMELGTFDLIFSEGVLHHTDSVQEALIYLASRLNSGGRFAFYVYAKKAPIREFTDDIVRNFISNMTDEEAWDALMPLSAFGKLLGDLGITVEIPDDIPALGIERGSYDLQRLFFYKICKAYYRPEYSLSEMNHINFDWFRPENCHRHSPVEIEQMCLNAGLKLERLRSEPSGITVIARK